MAEENEENTLTANELYFKEVENEHGKTLDLEESLRNSFVSLLLSRYSAAQSARDQHESRWLTAYHNYRGLYGKSIRFRESEKSRVFVKITKTKVLAAFGQLVDVITEGNLNAGSHSVAWDASQVSSGVYFINTEIGSDLSVQKVMLVK